MICTVIKGPTFKDAEKQIRLASQDADLVELRLDLFSHLDFAALRALRSRFSIPMIFTLKNGSKNDLSHLAEIGPDYLDIEHGRDWTPPGVKVILSYHDFAKIPEDLDGLYQEMRKTPAALYKIAVTPQNSLEAIRFMQWAKNKSLIAIGMGPHGQITRILSPFLNCPFTYAALDEEQTTAPGQLTAKTLLKTYRHATLHPQTGLYGLIGDPVSVSISDKTHNQFFQSAGLDAIYCKIQVAPEELPQFIQEAKSLPFQGLSVTMPHKEKILPLLDEIHKEAAFIGAVNTLVLKNGRILGYNTDGMGALRAIAKFTDVQNRHISVLGSGGAAKAIAYEAKKRGAFVTLLNRDVDRAKQVAKELDCHWGPLDSSQPYDILINCTPSHLPIDPSAILPGTTVMDIAIRPIETELLKHAKSKGCVVIPGYHMFTEQALGQFQLWLTDFYQLNKA